MRTEVQSTHQGFLVEYAPATLVKE